MLLSDTLDEKIEAQKTLALLVLRSFLLGLYPAIVNAV